MTAERACAQLFLFASMQAAQGNVLPIAIVTGISEFIVQGTIPVTKANTPFLHNIPLLRPLGEAKQHSQKAGAASLL
ncbi:hypothetical protein [Paenibacillus lupini]|uniref:hypothetical protein n=1 Tax=Paenibacillus lupini TaxID=1450204 RepID=UPI001423BC26|nr:hypothetical protein [Paenibacillus lupini]NIK25190.1 hypothetical protein [Paenibacillus lupini]